VKREDENIHSSLVEIETSPVTGHKTLLSMCISKKKRTKLPLACSAMCYMCMQQSLRSAMCIRTRCCLSI